MLSVQDDFSSAFLAVKATMIVLACVEVVAVESDRANIRFRLETTTDGFSAATTLFPGSFGRRMVRANDRGSPGTSRTGSQRVSSEILAKSASSFLGKDGSKSDGLRTPFPSATVPAMPNTYPSSDSFASSSDLKDSRAEGVNAQKLRRRGFSGPSQESKYPYVRAGGNPSALKSLELAILLLEGVEKAKAANSNVATSAGYSVTFIEI
jgi:hypothetical protein